jgi:hypothetical protein
VDKIQWYLDGIWTIAMRRRRPSTSSAGGLGPCVIFCTMALATEESNLGIRVDQNAVYKKIMKQQQQ